MALDTVDVDEIEELGVEAGPAWDAPASAGPLAPLRAKLSALEGEIAQAERGFAEQLERMQRELAEARERKDAAERRLLALKELLEDA